MFANTLKTTLLLGLMTGLVMAVGGALGGQNGIMIAFAFAAMMNLGTWFFADRIVLATSGAKPIDDPSLRWVEQDVEDLARRAGIPKPRVFWVPTEMSPNAFATGRSPSKGVVAVTAGLVRTLDRRQVRGVLAHEIGHIAHRDTLVSAVAATMAGAISMLARSFMWFGGSRDREGGGNPILGLVMMIVAPLMAAMIHMAVSRTREYMADRYAADLTGDPEGLASALEALAYGTARIPMHTGSEATHYIVPGLPGGLARLFSTHPPMEERIRRLRGR